MLPLTEKCSLFKTYLHKEHGWCFSTKPETVRIIDMLITPLQSELLAKVRSITAKDERDFFKKQLWGITPASTMFGGRGVKHIIDHSGLMAFDIDKINGLTMTPELVNQVKEIVKQIPYTVYCGMSASGLGVWGLFRISNIEKYSEHFAAMSAQFKNIGIEIDPAPSSTGSLRFISYDENYYLNEDAKIFTKVLKRVEKIFNPLNSNKGISNGEIDGKELIRRFNSECSPADIYIILENYGFQFHSLKGEHYYFTRPSKNVQAGLSLDYHATKRTLYSFSSETPGLKHWKPEKAGWSCSPLTALQLYGFGGISHSDQTAKKEHWAKIFAYIKSRI